MASETDYETSAFRSLCIGLSCDGLVIKIFTLLLPFLYYLFCLLRSSDSSISISETIIHRTISQFLAEIIVISILVMFPV